MNTSQKIKLLLQEKGWSQSKLASISGISQPNINNIINNKQSPSNKTLENIAKALDVSVLDLVEDGKDLSLLDNQVFGYLEFAGVITRISSIRDIKNWLKRYEKAINGLQYSYSSIQSKNKQNKIIVEKNTSYNYNDIDLFREEDYDCERNHIWSFRKAEDYDVSSDGEEIQNNLGNMCKGYPFYINEHKFLNSEAAYICGLFSSPSPQHISIQRELQLESSGYNAKKKIRHKYQVDAIPVSEWKSFNVQWMLYVVWCKCKTNKAFQHLLLKVPKDAIIVENVSFQNDSERNKTSTFWGARNEELKEAVSTIEKYIRYKHPHYPKKELDKILMKERVNIKYIGRYRGVNCMGKILKLCQLALLEGTEPYIDYDLLRSKNIHLFGNLLEF